MTIKHYALKQIDANPFQLRDHEDPEHIRGLADSILAQAIVAVIAEAEVLQHG
jgi:ParB-like chromosome segregation protein Spo0J